MATTKKVFRARRLKLAKFLRTLKRSQFDIGTWQNECGTVCCAGGWCPTAFPESFCVRDRHPYLRRGSTGTTGFDLQKFFGDCFGKNICAFYSPVGYFSLNPTPKTVAKRIESIK